MSAYPYVWWWHCRLPERKGQPCKVTARGGMNSIRVEFADGYRTITSRFAVRLRKLAEAQECICVNEATSMHCPIHGEPQEGKE